MKTCAVIFTTLILSAAANADILNVPDDFDTIQDAIDDAAAGDTVLVAPGEYEENLDIPDREMTIGSLFLTTGNESYLDSTVIDGSGGDATSVVTFDGVEEDIILTGFTITGGTGRFGGGINCVGSSPTLTHLILTENNSGWRGGGIMCGEGSEPVIENVIIINNTAPFGGGIGIEDSRPQITHTLIADNSSAAEGGGFYLNVGSISLSNCTFANNECDRASSLYFLGNDLDIINCIFWGSAEADVFIVMGNATIDYCDIEDGRDGVSGGNVNYGDNNIDDDPEFVDPDGSDYHLTADSPCIDAGDPDSPDDPDGSRADIGAFPYGEPLVLQGYVYDLFDDSPLEDALVMTSTGAFARTDDIGFCSIPIAGGGVFDVTVSKQGYNDSTVTDVEFGDADTLVIEFGLTHPTFVYAGDPFEAELDPDSSTTFDFTIGNEGNGPLDWSVRPGLRGEADFPPFELRRSINASQTVNDSRIEGVVFTDDLFYVSGGGNDDNMIYVLNREGELQRSFEQPGETRYGLYDLAFDGELLWGGNNSDDIFGFTTEGEVMHTWDGPERANQALAWDTNREALWIAGITSSEIKAFNDEGQGITSISQFDLWIYGLAYWAEDPDGYQLYALTNPNVNSDMALLYKIDIENEDTLFVASLEHPDGGPPRGTFIVDQYDVYSSVFMSVTNNVADDRIDIWQLGANTSWMTVEPAEGAIDPDGEQDFVLTLDASGLPSEVFEGKLVFNHNAGEGVSEIPVTLTVTVPDGIGDGAVTQPLEFALFPAYPNPFNSSTSIKYSIPTAQAVSLRILDLHGRVVATLHEGRAKRGTHSLSFNGLNLSSGVYLVTLESISQRQIEKLTLIR